ncbi:hypothetical protein DPMN_132398 [Dreissena polymorpha]|uniref:Uncharacterized protein n=1 Tax=Dreissena polymorpha TaxID=45954 RepID=A0A9D4FW17_DREPO|nr:hypothetical protein DPMN_132398 [Dreissena polymorpha]
MNLYTFSQELGDNFCTNAQAVVTSCSQATIRSLLDLFRFHLFYFHSRPDYFQADVLRLAAKSSLPYSPSSTRCRARKLPADTSTGRRQLESNTCLLKIM